MSQNYFDPTQSDAVTSMANAMANQAYYNAMARGQDSSAALNAAKFAWQQKMDEANQTGMWNGQYNMPSQQNFATMFGSWMPEGPTAGQETMAREGQTYAQQQGYGQQYGQYYAPGTAPTQGQQTLASQNQANQLGLAQAGLTGYYNAPGAAPGSQGQQTLAGQQQQFSQGLQTEQEARAAQAQQQSQAQSYLQLLSSLRGPADWAKYQQVLGSTPGGMRDLAAAAMGQYVPGGGATTGYQPQAVSLQSMMGDVSGNPYYGQGGGQLNMPSVYGGGQGSYGQPQQQGQPQQFQAMTQGQLRSNVMPNSGQQDQRMSAQGGGVPQWQQASPEQQQQQNMYGQVATMSQQPQQAWGSGIGIGPQQATPQQQQQGLGGGANAMGQMPAPNQIAAQSWKNLAPSQQQMLLGGYEAQGWNKDDVTALMNQSLPKYTGGATGVGTYRLQ
jgi:hypothetical protein